MDWTGNSASFGIFNGISRGKTGGSKESEGHKRQTYKEIRQDEGIIYVNITNYNDSDISFVTFTGKVLYIVDDLITDE